MMIRRMGYQKKSQRILPSLIILGLVGLMSVTWAGEGFSRKDIAGKWAFSADGTVVPPAVPAATPVALVGTATFEENGECSLTDTINIGGTSFTVSSLSCTFTVASDGTGSIEADFGGPLSPELLSIVVVDTKEILVVRTDVVVARGSFKRQTADDDDDDDDD